jgi:hypothetical protein
VQVVVADGGAARWDGAPVPRADAYLLAAVTSERRVQLLQP